VTDEFSPQELESIELLESLLPVPPRSNIGAENGKAAFLSQAKQLSLPVSPDGFLRLNWWDRLLQRFRVRPSTLSIALLFSFLFLATTSTVYAAQQSLPGDQFYPIKLRIEDARIALSNQDSTDLALHINFAQERLDEMRLTTLPGDSPEIILLKGNFQAHIENAHLLTGGDLDAQAKVQKLIDEYVLLTHAEDTDETSDDHEAPDTTPEEPEDIEDHDQEETPEGTEGDEDDSESESSQSSEQEEAQDRSEEEDDGSAPARDEEEEEDEREEEEEKD
jgi:hypothetical protein